MVNELLNMASSDAGKMVIGLVGVLAFVVVNALMLTWAERKIAGHMQRRIGPKEVGPFGLIQPIADALKLLGKEILTPAKVDKPLYYLAPTLIFVPVLVSFIVIPFDASLQVTDINVGILVILAFSSITVLSILMAGMGLGKQVLAHRRHQERGPEYRLRNPPAFGASARDHAGQFPVSQGYRRETAGAVVCRHPAAGLYHLFYRRAWPRPTGRLSIFPKRRANWSPVTIRNIRG